MHHAFGLGREMRHWRSGPGIAGKQLHERGSTQSARGPGQEIAARITITHEFHFVVRNYYPNQERSGNIERQARDQRLRLNHTTLKELVSPLFFTFGLEK